MPHLPAISPPGLLILFMVTASCSSSGPGADARIACTDIGCAPSLRIQFARARWPAGTYRIEVTADAANEVCQVTVPLSCSASSMCMGLGGLEVFPEVSGCSLDPGLHTIEGVTFTFSVPASVTVRVVQGQDDEARELGTGTFTPSYITSRPNGPDCLPVCHTAPTETLTLAP